MKEQSITELLNIQDWKVENIEINEDGQYIKIKLKHDRTKPYICSCCGECFMFAYDHYKPRIVEDMKCFGYRTFIEFEQARLQCYKSNSIQPEMLDWIKPRQHQTIRLQRYLASLCDYMPVADVARVTHIGKNVLYRIDKEYLQERKETISQPKVRYLGIDEIAIQKGHKYATVFYDLERSMVIGMVKGRKQRNVSSFFRKWGKENCRNVTAVCTDLWSAFHNSVKVHLKNADLVFDKFHVFKYLSTAIDEVRREEQARAEESGRKLIKGCRWIMLKNDLKSKQRKRLDQIVKDNINIAKAMLLKESFTIFYEAETKEEALNILGEWVEQCKESGLKPFVKLAKRLSYWKDGILEYFKHRITNGISEGINNKIKVIKRRSYGFQDIDYFLLKILRATGFIPTMEEAYPRKP